MHASVILTVDRRRSHTSLLFFCVVSFLLSDLLSRVIIDATSSADTTLSFDHVFVTDFDFLTRALYFNIQFFELFSELNERVGATTDVAGFNRYD